MIKTKEVLILITMCITKEELAEFIVENQKKLYRFAYTYVKKEETALDVVQNAAIKALTSYKSLKEPRYLKTWFYRILINEAITMLKKDKKYVMTDEIELYQKDISYKDTNTIDLYEAVKHLPEKYKSIIILRYFEDMKLADIAKILEAPESTIKTRLKTALTQLKQVM